jgi:signal transduction histidine kinase/CheY-like chemotaxis protein
MQVGQLLVLDKNPIFGSLAVKIALLFVTMLLVMLAVFLMVMEQYGNRVLLDVAKQQVRQSGESMVAVLGKRLTIAESTVNAMANAAESLPAIDQLHHQVIKPIIDYDDSDHFIAGGGIWPEPFLYDEKKARYSFFWGRNQQGELKFFDDYNNPKADGYHFEEWYSPSYLLKPGQIYWSRSYMDPYSLESMVTVAAPMFKNGEFYGAATLDLTLDGMDKLLAEESAKFGGYAYVLDRNGTFISYPDESVSKRHILTVDGKDEVQFTNISDVAKKKSGVQDVTAALLEIENISRLNKEMNLKALALASYSHNIGTYEAHRIISTIEDPLKLKSYGETFLKEFITEFDSIFKQPVLINVFHVPNAYWKVITVIPIDRVNQTSDRITKAVVTSFILVIVLGLLIGLFSIQIILINPIKKMQYQISEEGEGIITDIDSSELGDLALRFNTNNSALISANSELEKSVNKAEQATLAKAQFLANMSHEIRTPMNGVTGMLNLLQDSKLTEQQMHYANVAINSADSLLILINDILDFSKIESGKMDIECINFNIRDALMEFFPSMHHLADQKGLDLILDLTGLEVDWIKSDLGRIRQILTNLISNAVKFTSDGHVLVKISIKDVNEMGLILFASVTDTGIGIPEDKISTLFDSFSQVDESTTRKFGGTGLGLSISEQLCELMEGSISAKSKLDEGSRFDFTLKLEIGEIIYSEDIATVLNNKKIIVYDNNTKKDSELIEILKLCGAQVISNEFEKDLISSLESPFDFLLVNIKKINKNYDTRQEFKNIKNICLKNKIKVVGLTTVISPTYAEYYEDLGCDKVLLLPITEDALMSMTQHQRERKKVVRQVVSKFQLEEKFNKKYTLADAKILLVEDNMINQEVALGLLREMSILPDICSNGLVAVNTIVENLNDIEYDIILMDCQMPVMDGYEATRQIRLHEKKTTGKHIPIIAMTANAMKGDRELCIDAGMNDYISKPINVPLLQNKLMEWFEKSKVKST